MKNIFSKLLIIGIVSISMVNIGCKKDSGPERNYFNFADTVKHDIKYCGILNKGASFSNDTIFKYVILFSSSQITYDNSFNTLDSDGNFIKINFYSSGESDLLPGVYTFDAFSSEDDFTIDYCNVDCETIFDFNSGIMEVKKSGNTYNINLEFYYMDANPLMPPISLIGNFNGVIQDLTVVKK